MELGDVVKYIGDPSSPLGIYIGGLNWDFEGTYADFYWSDDGTVVPEYLHELEVINADR